MNQQKQNNMKPSNKQKLNKIANKAYDYLYARLAKGLSWSEVMNHKTMMTYRLQFEKEAQRIGSDDIFGDYLA